MKWSPTVIGLGMLALPLTAFAQEGQVSVYGTLLPFADHIWTNNATASGKSGPSQVAPAAFTGVNLPERNRLTSGTSNIGFRGELRLYEHIKAFFQVENAVSPDGDAPNAWAARNSGVGLTGDYGTLFFGNWDTPYKFPTLFVGPIRGLNPFDNALTGNPGFNVPGTTTQSGRSGGKPDAAFSRRQGNSVQYWTPNWRGLSARAAYSFNEGRTVTRTTGDTPGPSISPDLWSVLVSYDLDSFGVRYAYERHNDYFGLAQLGGSPGATFDNPGSNDDAHEIIVWYTAPWGTRLAGVVERLTYRSEDKTDGAVNRYERDAIYGAIQQRIGQHQIWGSIGFAGAGTCGKVGGGACSTNGLEGRQWSVGYTFSPAKSVDIYASYYEMDNNYAASYTLFPPLGAVAPGSSSRGFGLGILYTFQASVGFGATKPPEPPPTGAAAPPTGAVTPPTGAAAPPTGAAAPPTGAAAPASPATAAEPAAPAPPAPPATPKAD